MPNGHSRRELRGFFVAVAAGFGLSAYSSAAGAGPTWPNRLTFATIAAIAALATIVHAITRSAGSRRLMVAAIVLAGTTRAAGWLIVNEATIAFRLGAAGVLISMTAMALIVNQAMRRGL